MRYSNIPPVGSIPPSIRNYAPQRRKLTWREKFASPKPPPDTLERLLEWGMEEREKILEMMRLLPSEIKEYDMLQERLEKLEYVLAQVRRQLMERGY